MDIEDELKRIGISIPAELRCLFDEYIEQKGYETRSEAVRDLIRSELNKSHVSKNSESDQVFGTLTMVYDHHISALSDKITDIQHDHHESVLATTHVHIDHDNCLEVVIIKGKAGQIEKIANNIISLKGVKLGKTVMLEKDLP